MALRVITQADETLNGNVYKVINVERGTSDPASTTFNVLELMTVLNTITGLSVTTTYQGRFANSTSYEKILYTVTTSFSSGQRFILRCRFNLKDNTYGEQRILFPGGNTHNVWLDITGATTTTDNAYSIDIGRVELNVTVGFLVIEYAKLPTNVNMKGFDDNVFNLVFIRGAGAINIPTKECLKFIFKGNTEVHFDVYLNGNENQNFNAIIEALELNANMYNHGFIGSGNLLDIAVRDSSSGMELKQTTGGTKTASQYGIGNTFKVPSIKVSDFGRDQNNVVSFYFTKTPTGTNLSGADFPNVSEVEISKQEIKKFSFLRPGSSASNASNNNAASNNNPLIYYFFDLGIDLRIVAAPNNSFVSNNWQMFFGRSFNISPKKCDGSAHTRGVAIIKSSFNYNSDTYLNGGVIQTGSNWNNRQKKLFNVIESEYHVVDINSSGDIISVLLYSYLQRARFQIFGAGANQILARNLTGLAHDDTAPSALPEGTTHSKYDIWINGEGYDRDKEEMTLYNIKSGSNNNNALVNDDNFLEGITRELTAEPFDYNVNIYTSLGAISVTQIHIGYSTNVGGESISIRLTGNITLQQLSSYIQQLPSIEARKYLAISNPTAEQETAKNNALRVIEALNSNMKLVSTDGSTIVLASGIDITITNNSVLSYSGYHDSLRLGGTNTYLEDTGSSNTLENIEDFTGNRTVRFINFAQANRLRIYATEAHFEADGVYASTNTSEYNLTGIITYKYRYLKANTQTLRYWRVFVSTANGSAEAKTGSFDISQNSIPDISVFGSTEMLFSINNSIQSILAGITGTNTKIDQLVDEGDVLAKGLVATATSPYTTFVFIPVNNSNIPFKTGLFTGKQINIIQAGDIHNRKPKFTTYITGHTYIALTNTLTIAEAPPFGNNGASLLSVNDIIIIKDVTQGDEVEIKSTVAEINQNTSRSS